MTELLDIVKAHFLETSVSDDGEAGIGRIIIFTNLRSSVDTIVDMLNHHQPLIHAKYDLSTCSPNASFSRFRQT